MFAKICQKTLLGIAIGVLSACSNQPSVQSSVVRQSESPKAPIAARIDHKMVAHGHTRNDPYFWLRDDERKDPKVLAYLNAENEYTKAKMAHTESLQKVLFDEMTNRLEPNQQSLPLFSNGYWQYSQYPTGKDYVVHYRHKGTMDGKKEVLLDENIRATGLDYYALGNLVMSSDQQMMAIAEDTLGRRQYDIRIKNLATGELYPEVIVNTSGDIVWANDNHTLFYVRKDPVTLLPYQVYRHELGSDPKKDVLVFEETDKRFAASIKKTRSGKFIAISHFANESSEARFIDADKPTSAARVLYRRHENQKYIADHIGEYFYLRANHDAPNFMLYKVHQDDIGSRDKWQQVIAHKDDTVLDEVELFDQYIVTREREAGVMKLRLRDFDGGLIEDVPLNDVANAVYLNENPDPASTKVRYYYSSFTTPGSIFEYDFVKKSNQLLRQDKVLGNYDPNNYQSERVVIEARDGAKVPVSLVYRKDLFKKDGSNPLLNHAYGSYGFTIDAYFNGSRISLLDRGFVFALTHVRGGQILGRQWYENGKKLHKRNTFTDFNDATKALVAQGYGDKDRVFAMGSSAGGLLMAAITNMEPDLYRGVVAIVPFVDVLTSMLDDTLPLTIGEYDEWGNPNDKAFYDYILSYSPYDQVKAQDYPNMLVTTGLHDTQVPYFEPAKWVAKLRALKTDDNLLLLDIDMDAGHGGKSGRYKRYLDRAKRYAFLLDLAGIN